MYRMRVTPRPAIVIALAFALLFAACSTSGASGDGGGQASNDGPSTGSAVSPTDQVVSASPIDAFLGIPSIDPSDPAAAAQFEESERQRQEAVAECMQAEGFEYTPVDPAEFSFTGVGADGLVWGTEEWVQKYGFGVTTQAFSQAEVGSEAVGYDNSQFTDGADVNDPNAAYVASLSADDQEAYRKALSGVQPDFDPATMTDEEIDELFDDPVVSGCSNAGNDRLAEVRQQAFYQEFGGQLDQMWDAIDNDPRILEAAAAVEACVTDQGLPFISEADAYLFFDGRLAPIRERTYQESAVSAPDVNSLTDEELEEYYDNLPRPEVSDEDLVILGELQAEEIASAVAAFECGGSGADEAELFSELQIEYEQRFLDDNASAIDAFSASN